MQLKCPSSDDGQINKNSSQQNITSNKINRVLPYAITWMNLENINLSEKKKSQSFWDGEMVQWAKVASAT